MQNDYNSVVEGVCTGNDLKWRKKKSTVGLSVQCFTTSLPTHYYTQHICELFQWICDVYILRPSNLSKLPCFYPSCYASLWPGALFQEASLLSELKNLVDLFFFAAVLFTLVSRVFKGWCTQILHKYFSSSHADLMGFSYLLTSRVLLCFILSLRLLHCQLEAVKHLHSYIYIFWKLHRTSCQHIW